MIDFFTRRDFFQLQLDEGFRTVVGIGPGHDRRQVLEGGCEEVLVLLRLATAQLAEDSQSLGEGTTTSVVSSITIVILADAVFAILFQSVGL